LRVAGSVKQKKNVGKKQNNTLQRNWNRVDKKGVQTPHRAKGTKGTVKKPTTMARKNENREEGGG